MIQQPLNGVLLAVDFGLKRVGLAVCDAEGRMAVGAGRIEGRSTKELTKSIVETARIRTVAGVVVGLPESTRGNEELIGAIEELGAKLTSAGLPVSTWAERFSTASALAERKFYGGKGNGAKSWADEAAAIIILQDYLDWRRMRLAQDKIAPIGGEIA